MNGATIENAREAVVNRKYDDWNSMGGIIQADNANFINNHRAILFMPYSNFNPNNPSETRDDLSFINNCNFETNNNLIDGQFHSFITMWKVKGIQITGCTFENNNPNALSNDDLGMGVYSLDADYDIDNSCSNSQVSPCPAGDIIKSQFTHLKYGIKAEKSETNNTYTVMNTEFTNCAYGICNSGVDNASIKLNQIKYIAPYSLCPGTVVGIYFNPGTGYAIEENVFTSNLSSAFTTIGAYMVNAGQINNQIYKNSLNGYTYGLESVGNNRDQSGANGLRFFCNTFTEDKTTDIYVKRASGSYINQGVALIQGVSGTPGLSAGNMFYSSSPPSYHIYNSSGFAMNYYVNTTQLPECPSLSYGSLTIVNNIPSNTCPSNISGGGGITMSLLSIPALETNYFTEKDAETSIKNLLKTLIDGGNTEALTQTVENSWPPDTWNLRANLLSKSPYLSEDVLAETQEKSQVLPNPILFEIYKANPDGLNKDELLDKLLEKNNPMSEWMVDSLKSARKNETYRSQLEGSLSYHALKKEQIAHDIIKIILNDSSGVNHGLLQTWFFRMNNYQADIMAISDYCQTENYHSAQAILDNIPAKFNLSSEELQEHQTFVDLFGYLKSFNEHSKTIYQLDSSEVLLIKQLADEGFGLGKIYARSICAIYGYIYDPVIEIDEEFSQNKSLKINIHGGIAPIDKDTFISIYPTPAREWLVIKWEFPVYAGLSQIKIVNAQGVDQVVLDLKGISGENILDTKEWNAGIYYFKAIQNNQIIQTGKIVVIK